MSNISRRKFLKGAGVVALAVAAAGVLAGCNKADVGPDPVVPPVKDPTKEEIILAAIDPEGKLTQTDVLSEDTLYLLLAYINGDQTGDMSQYYMDLSKTMYKTVDEKFYISRGPVACGVKAEDFSVEAVKDALASYKYGADATLVDIAIKEIEGVVYFAIVPIAVQ